MNLMRSSIRESGQFVRKDNEVCKEFGYVANRRICCYGVLTE